MDLIDPEERPGLQTSDKLSHRYNQFKLLCNSLKGRDIPDELMYQINGMIDDLNKVDSSDRSFKKALNRTQTSLIKFAEKQLNLVPRNYYRNLWIGLGMTAFGVPLGVIFGVALGNMGFIGAGIGAGLAIGLAVGASLDKKAEEEGRQLDVDSQM